MSLIKTPDELKILRLAGQKLSEVLQAAYDACEEGVSCLELDEVIRLAILERASTPSFLGYDGYPKSSCISINNQVVHGIPTDRIISPGDVVGIDAGLWYKGLCVDSALTKIVGGPESNPEAAHLIEITKQALKAGIKAVKPYQRVGNISHAIENWALENNLGIVRTLTGHGVGHHVHEAPDIPNFGKSSDGILLKPGMVLAIEPMFTLGGGEVETEVDGWGVVTSDSSLAAHYEHTVIVTNKGAEVITKTLANP